MKLFTPNIMFRNRLIPLKKEEVKYIVIHHAQAVQATWENIHRWHLERGWAGAGYNEYIRKNGEVYILRGNRQGVHAKGYNRISYGICLEGDYRNEKEIPILQFHALMVRIVVKKLEFPHAQVKLHRQLCDTDCPGKYFPMFR